MPFRKKCVIAKLGETILRQKAQVVEDVTDKNIQKVIKKLLRCVKESRGVGLAAPQVFEPYQILIISSAPNERYPDAPLMKEEVLINPKVLSYSGSVLKAYEGCLSIPGIRALVPRDVEIEVEYTTINNETIQVVFKDFIARVFLHEYDHLIGKVFLDRVEDSMDIISEEVFYKLTQ